MAQWSSACFEIEGLWVRASPEALRFVLEQDTYLLLNTDSTKEDPSQKT